MRTRNSILVMLMMAVLAATAFGQQPPPIADVKPMDLNAAYRLDYVIAEIEGGKRVNTRTYTLLTDDGGEGRMNMGMRVPVQLGEKGIQYMEVGLHINAKVRPRENNTVWLSTRFELSGLIDQASNSSSAPTLRTVEYATPTVLALAKSTVIAGGDDLGSLKHFELSVTVTKLK